MKYKPDAAGRLLLIDPDDQDDIARAAGTLEGCCSTGGLLS
jgi:hypothetical protein